MGTVKWNPVLSGVCALLGGMVLWTGTSVADVRADEAAGLIVWPKLVFNSDNGTDTVIQLSNTSPDQINVRCFYVNANSHCSNTPVGESGVCYINDDCEQFGLGGICLEGWIETDFSFTLTGNQPIAWTLSDGLPFFPLDGFERVGPGNQSNGPLSAIPPAPEDPFQGELKCVQVAEDETPTDRNDLKGEATIVQATEGFLDARGYNAIGIQAIAGANDGDNELMIGGEAPEYNGCPNILIMDHFFDDALVFSDSEGTLNGNSAYVRSHLTVVPCSQDFLLQDVALFDTVIQFLVFNEFEQRFSTSRSVRCFKEFELSAIDTRQDRGLDDDDPASNNNYRSIFNVNVQGTLTGHTRMRPVDDGSEFHGNGLIGVVEEFHRDEVDDLDSLRASAAFQLHHTGERADKDIIRIP